MINYIKNLFSKEKQPERLTKEQLEQIEKLVDAKISKVIDAIKKDNSKIDVNYKWYRNDESAVDDIGQIGAAIRSRDFNLYRELQDKYGFVLFPPVCLHLYRREMCWQA